MDIVKEATIEYIENMYAIGINHLKDNNNIELKNILKELELLGDNIRKSTDIGNLNNYKNILESLFDRIEVIINE